MSPFEAQSVSGHNNLNPSLARAPSTRVPGDRVMWWIVMRAWALFAAWVTQVSVFVGMLVIGY